MAKPQKTFGIPDGYVSLAEYARRIDVTKPAMSRMVAKGLPYIQAKDDHGRDCKCVRPDEADTWRTLNLEVRVTLDGVRGAVTPGQSTKPSGKGTEGAETPTHPAPPGATRGPPSRQTGGSAAQAPLDLGPQSKARDEHIADHQARAIEARSREQEIKTELAELNLNKAAGVLLHRNAAVGTFKNFVGEVGQTIAKMPSDAASLVAAKLGVTEHDAYLVLRDVVALRMRTSLERHCRSKAALFGADPAAAAALAGGQDAGSGG